MYLGILKPMNNSVVNLGSGWEAVNGTPSYPTAQHCAEGAAVHLTSVALERWISRTQTYSFFFVANKVC